MLSEVFCPAKSALFYYYFIIMRLSAYVAAVKPHEAVSLNCHQCKPKFCRKKECSCTGNLPILDLRCVGDYKMIRSFSDVLV